MCTDPLAFVSSNRIGPETSYVRSNDPCDAPPLVLHPASATAATKTESELVRFVLRKILSPLISLELGPCRPVRRLSLPLHYLIREIPCRCSPASMFDGPRQRLTLSRS